MTSEMPGGKRGRILGTSWVASWSAGPALFFSTGVLGIVHQLLGFSSRVKAWQRGKKRKNPCHWTCAPTMMVNTMRPSEFYRRFSSWPLGPWYLQTTMTRLCVPSSVDEIPERFVVQIKMFVSMRCLKFWHYAHQDSSRVFLWFLHQFFHVDHLGDVKVRTQTSNFCDSRGQGQRCRGREICQGEAAWIFLFFFAYFVGWLSLTIQFFPIKVDST